MVQGKMNLYLSLPIYNVISTCNVKDENVINNPRVAYSHKHKKMIMNNISTSGGLTVRGSAFGRFTPADTRCGFSDVGEVV